jgi:hypothetical protein
MGWEEHVVGKRRKVDTGFMWKPEGKRKTGRPRRRWEGN